MEILKSHIERFKVIQEVYKDQETIKNTISSLNWETNFSFKLSKLSMLHKLSKSNNEFKKHFLDILN